MGPVVLPDAAQGTAGTGEDTDVRDRAWQAWQPWKTAAIGAHVVGSLGLLWGNKGRLAGQRGAMVTNLVKTGVFAAALGADVTAAKLGARYASERGTSAADADGTAQQLRTAQWATAALTGANVALGAKMGEQQRPTNVFAGALGRLDPRH